MTFKEQRAIFRQMLENNESNTHTSTAYGASNGALLLENSFRLGLFNIDLSQDRIDELADRFGGLALLGSVTVPPARLLNIALVFRGEALERIGDRLEVIRSGGVPKADKVRIYLHRTGIYLRQARDPQHLDIEDVETGAALFATHCWFSDVASPVMKPAQHSWIGYVAGLLDLMPRPPKIGILHSGERGVLPIGPTG